MSEGDTDVAVVNYQKQWTMHGGHLMSNPIGLDRVKWVLTTTPGCDDSGGMFTPTADFVTGDNISLTVQSNAAVFNATTGSKVREATPPPLRLASLIARRFLVIITVLTTQTPLP